MTDPFSESKAASSALHWGWGCGARRPPRQRGLFCPVWKAGCLPPTPRPRRREGDLAAKQKLGALLRGGCSAQANRHRERQLRQQTRLDRGGFGRTQELCSGGPGTEDRRIRPRQAVTVCCHCGSQEQGRRHLSDARLTGTLHPSEIAGTHVSAGDQDAGSETGVSACGRGVRRRAARSGGGAAMGAPQ